MSTSDFERGVEFTAGTHYAFMRKQGEATNELGKRIIQKIDAQGNIIDVIIDSLNQMEMERIFGMCVPLDIAKLDESEKEKLLACLKALYVSYSQGTQQQLDYFYAVKKYLKIANISDTFDFVGISRLDISKSQLKTFFECVCEFLFLKTGTRQFLTDFSVLIEYFGFNEKIIDEIVSSIEKTYTYFGVRGIVEHYNVECKVESEEKQDEPIAIPFFEEKIIIVHGKDEKKYADKLESTIHETLKNMNAKKPTEVSTISEKEYESKKHNYKGKYHIIYIGIPKDAESLEKIMDWDFDKFGMRYGTSGEKSIIVAEKLKKRDREVFAEYVNQNSGRWKDDTLKIVKLLNDSFIKDAYDKDEMVVNVLATMIGGPILIAGCIADVFSHAELKEKLLDFQYYIAIDDFVLSKIAPYIPEKK